VDTNYIFLKSRRKNITHKATEMTLYGISADPHTDTYQDSITSTPQQMHIPDNISTNQYITTLLKNSAVITSVHFKASKQKISQLRSALNQYERTCPTRKTNLLDAVWLQLTAYQ